MISQDVRDAAERLRTPWTIHGRKISEIENHTNQWFEDAKTITDAYLSEHPADDEQVIDETWLKGAGFVKEDHPQKWRVTREDALPLGLWSVDDGWKAMLIHTAHASSCIVRGLTTRSDVRRLCTALGIKLQEPSPCK